MKEIVAGVDIGGTNTVFGLVDIDGKIVAENNAAVLGAAALAWKELSK